MIDLRNFKESIKTAVAKERAADQYWSWSIDKVNKDIATINWGYLDYIGETEKFKIEIMDKDFKAVIATLPDESYKVIFVGDEVYSDTKTFEDGIEKAIHEMAVRAHSIY